MKNIEIKINKETRKVELNKYVIGNDGENLQGNLVFSFDDEFVDGQARLEYIIEGNKYYSILEKDGETYQTPILSVITKKGQIDMQLVITEDNEENAMPIFKSNVFYLTCNASINAEIEQPEEYPQWIEVANAKLNQIDNLDIDATKEDGVATITITKKDGSQESVEIYDGTSGGESGTSNYEELQNLPLINDVVLIGNKTLDDLDIQPKGNYATTDDIPTKTSDLTNDSGFITGYVEDDPTVPMYVKNISEQDITNWNNKSEFSGNYNDLIDAPTLFSGDYNDLTNKPDLTNFATTQYVDDLVGNIESLLSEV